MADDIPGYRGLLVDWGGVMTTSPFASFRAFGEQEGLEPDTIGELFRRDRASRALLVGIEDGSIPQPEFESRFATILGVDPAGLVDRMFAGAVTDQAMQDAVRRSRAAGIRTGLISNSWGTARYDRHLLAELFDGVVLSEEVRMRKPAPEIYALGAQAVGLPPATCVFVDDLTFNLGPAQELGMATVHHVDARRTIGELERLLAVALR
jgi:epoxide hydrolase-like predicted phosphatase